jgi:microcystin-dependent protein
MPSSFSPTLRIELIQTGQQSGQWGNTTNSNLGTIIEQAITGITNLDVTSGNITLTALDGVVDQARSAVLAVTGTPGVTRVLTIPNVAKLYTVRNATANIVQVKTASGTAFDCPALSQSYIVCDGANVVTGRSITDGANTITASAAPFNSPTFTGVPIAPTAAPGTNTTQLATTAFVLAAFPVGGIILWSGSIASVPSGWALCNGSSGTPDLRDRFIVGAGSTYAVNDTGGFNTVTLTTAQMPTHTHTNSVSTVNLDHTHTGSGTTGDNSVGHDHGVSGTTSIQNADHQHTGATDGQGNHAHAQQGAPGQSTPDGSLVAAIGYGGGPAPVGYDTAVAGLHYHNVSTGIQNANHAHTFSVTSAGQSANHNHTYSFTTSAMSANQTHSHTVTNNNEGGSTAHENRPPYYALAYIMKL